MAARGKGVRKAMAGRPAPADAAINPASAPKSRGRKQQPSPECPGEAKASLLNETSGCSPRGKGSAPGGRNVSLENSSPKAEKCDPAGKSKQPAEDAGALQKKQARHSKVKAEVVSGALSREKNHVPSQEEPDREEKGAPLRGKKTSQKERVSAAEQPDHGRAAAAAAAAAAAVPRVEPPARRRSLRDVLKSLIMRKGEISDAAKRVNSVRELLKEAIQKKLPVDSVEILNTGSYYEHHKIYKPNEFDIMFKVPGVRGDLELYDDGDCKGAYYFIQWARNPKLKDFKKNFVNDQDRLSASKILTKLRAVIVDTVKTIKEMKVIVERKKPGSPAVTLLIEKPPSHISVDIILALEMESKTLGNIWKRGPDIKKWLGEKSSRDLDRMKLCLVPKNAKAGEDFIDTWRLSFSLAEKTIIHNHGNTKTCCEANGKKCCRKDCLKLLKNLLEELKTKHKNKNQFKKFCSYYAKTAFLHACTKWTSDEDWCPANLDECFERLLDYFLDCLRKAELKHFFIPDCNLFCCDLKCSKLAQAIESERNNGFPIFE
ncbi:cyclic GMP-AMP synthase [Paroedura picta]|uniref:cyclic GMP-AMP synthase n=1 Tax=Paroedura picta TaxID=143630 RepID=UPI004056ADFA